MKDLFGEEPAKIKNPRAYAGTPGLGPPGKTCGDCRYRVQVLYHARKYPKCEKNRGSWSHASSTDCHRGTLACQHFEEKP